jgi:O-methyltransferase
MSRKILRKAIDKAYGARRLLASKELKAISAYSMGSFLTLENLNALAVDVLERDIQGDFVECGVFNGGSAAAVACAIRSSDRKIWLYDSFEGMPEITAADGPVAADFVGECVGDEAKVHAAMRLARFPEDRYVIRKGWFQDTFTAGPMSGSVAFLHIDADWYDSVQLALETFYDRVSTGGVIILDDFGHWEGCREAFYDFAADRGIKPLLERFGHTQAYWIKDRTHNRI